MKPVFIIGVYKYNKTGTIHLWRKTGGEFLYAECTGFAVREFDLQPESEGVKWCARCAKNPNIN